MLTFFCPACWEEISSGTAVCPHCRFEISANAGIEFEQKLLAALHHPVAEYRYFAIDLLGKRGSVLAVPVLAELVRTEQIDIYLIDKALTALAAIPGNPSRAVLKEALQHPIALAQKRARELLKI